MAILLPCNVKEPHACYECGAPAPDGSRYCGECLSIIAARPVDIDRLTDALIRRDALRSVRA